MVYRFGEETPEGVRGVIMDIQFSILGDNSRTNMMVRLEEFFDGGRVPMFKVKRLVNSIRESQEPEELNKVQSYVEQYRKDHGLTDEETLEITKKNFANKYVGFESKLPLAEGAVKKMMDHIEKLKAVKKMSKRGTEQWYDFDTRIKNAKDNLQELKDEVSFIKRSMKEMKSQFDSIDRRKKKWDSIAAAVK